MNFIINKRRTNQSRQIVWFNISRCFDQFVCGTFFFMNEGLLFVYLIWYTSYIYTYIKVNKSSPIKKNLSMHVQLNKSELFHTFQIYLSFQIFTLFYLVYRFTRIPIKWPWATTPKLFFHGQSTLKHGRIGVARVKMLIMTQFHQGSNSTNHVHIILSEKQWPSKLIKFW